jgi:hypothetical protein
MVCDAGVLHFEVLRAEAASASGSGRGVQVGVARVDLLKLAPWRDWRETLLSYDPNAGESGGLRVLSNPTPPSPNLGELGVLSEQVPVILLQEELHSRGWRAAPQGERPANQDSPAPALLCRQRLGWRGYLQCCLHLEVLWGRGLQSFAHGAAVRYYKLLLRAEDPSSVPTRASAQVYQRLTSDARALGAMALPPPADADDGLLGSGDEAPRAFVSDDEAGEVPELVLRSAGQRPRRARGRSPGSGCGARP